MGERVGPNRSRYKVLDLWRSSQVIGYPIQRERLQSLESSDMAQKTVMFTRFNNIVNGEARTSIHLTSGIDPSTGSPLWDVPVASEEDFNQAVIAAQKAFKDWSWMSGKKRQGHLAELRDTLLHYREEMVELIIKETGKPVSFSFDLYIG